MEREVGRLQLDEAGGRLSAGLDLRRLFLTCRDPSVINCGSASRQRRPSPRSSLAAGTMETEEADTDEGSDGALKVDRRCRRLRRGFGWRGIGCAEGDVRCVRRGPGAWTCWPLEAHDAVDRGGRFRLVGRLPREALPWSENPRRSPPLPVGPCLWGASCAWTTRRRVAWWRLPTPLASAWVVLAA